MMVRADILQHCHGHMRFNQHPCAPSCLPGSRGWPHRNTYQALYNVVHMLPPLSELYAEGDFQPLFEDIKHSSCVKNKEQTGKPMCVDGITIAIKTFVNDPY